jgi:hypothetical protein
MTIVQEIKEQITQLELKLINIQKNCSHPKDVIVSVNRSNTGNYDPSADRYWTDHHCTFCDKRWSSDQ